MLRIVWAAVMPSLASAIIDAAHTARASCSGRRGWRLAGRGAGEKGEGVVSAADTHLPYRPQIEVSAAPPCKFKLLEPCLKIEDVVEQQNAHAKCEDCTVPGLPPLHLPARITRSCSCCVFYSKYFAVLGRQQASKRPTRLLPELAGLARQTPESVNPGKIQTKKK